jgi:pyruvate dehydrogenase E1 component alpha subunit
MDDLIKEQPSVAVKLFYRMMEIRLVEEEIAKRYFEWKMRCPTHLCIGQEAIAAAVGMVLKEDDFMVSGHRAHGHYLGKGGDLKKMIAEIYGKVTGCSAGKGGSMHLIDKEKKFMGSTAIVGGTIPVGVGLGLSIKLQGKSQISCIFFGDGATEEGVFYESINYAALKKLPVLFICENNYYSVYSPLKVRQPASRNVCRLVESMGIHSGHGDGNNVAEVYRKVNESVRDIRNGHGSCFLEFTTYRWREHCGPNYDNNIGYRSEEEYKSWKERDPIALLESRLLEHGVISEVDIEKKEMDICQEISDAFTFSENSSFPTPDQAFKGLYA